MSDLSEIADKAAEFKFDKLRPDQQAALIQTLDNTLGFTPERATAFLLESRAEHPEKDAAWHQDDATGKFEHFLRTARHWQGAVDVAWPFLKPFAAAIVQSVIDAGA